MKHQADPGSTRGQPSASTGCGETKKAKHRPHQLIRVISVQTRASLPILSSNVGFRLCFRLHSLLETLSVNQCL